MQHTFYQCSRPDMVDILLYPVTEHPPFSNSQATGDTFIHTIVYYSIRHSNTDSSVLPKLALYRLYCLIPTDNLLENEYSLRLPCSALTEVLIVGQSNKCLKNRYAVGTL